MFLLKKIKNFDLQNIRKAWLYRKFISLKTSIVILSLLLCFYVLGSIFPQESRLDDYIKEGGRFISFVIFFDLLNIFATPGFLITALLLFINLIICTFERFIILFNQKNAITVRDLQFIPAVTIPLVKDSKIEDCTGYIKEIFIDRLNFKEKASDIETGIKILEKGLSYKWLTWIYHLSILFCFLGFFLTYLFSYEDEITLYPNEAVIIKPTVLSRWDKSLGNSPKAFDFNLMLGEFITEYNQIPSLDYPASKLSRLAIALGWKDPKYTLKNDFYFPKDWKSRLKVIKEKQVVLEKTIEVNDPLYYQSIRFYQSAYKQDLKIQLDDDPIILETETEKDLIIPGIDGRLRFDTVITGTLFKKDGAMEKIKPFINVTFIKNARFSSFNPPVSPLIKGGIKEGGTDETEDLGKLELDGSLFIDDKKISLREFREASILSYRYDPGVTLLWWSGIIVLLAMSLRIFGAWHKIIYKIEKRAGIPYLLLKINTKGLMADEERLIRRLTHLIN